MSRMRRGQIGMLVLVVVLTLTTLGFGGATAVLSMKDRRETEALQQQLDVAKRYVDIAAGSSKANFSEFANKPARVTFLDALEGTANEQKAKVLHLLVLQYEELAGRLVGAARDESLLPEQIRQRTAGIIAKHASGLTITGSREEQITGAQQVIHLDLDSTLKIMRDNYNRVAAERDALKKSLDALNQKDAWATALTGTKISIRGTEGTLADLVKRELGAGAELDDPAKIIGQLAAFADALNKRANSEAEKAVATQTKYDEALAENKKQKEAFDEESKKAGTEYSEKVKSLDTELNTVKAAAEAEKAKLTGELEAHQRVMKERLRMLPDMITADVMLESGGFISQVNAQRKTVVLAISPLVRNKIQPGYRFSIYPSDPSVVMNKDSLKGKVEVVSVSGAFAEARILDVAREQTLLERDRIANPFVSRAVRHVTLIGWFDVDGDGVPTKDETQQLKDYINYKWGGRVDVDSVSAVAQGEEPKFVESSDFFVYGFVPRAPQPSDKETDAVRQDRLSKEFMNKQETMAREVAAKWAVPALSANRFLDMIGIVTRKDDPRSR